MKMSDTVRAAYLTISDFLVQHDETERAVKLLTDIVPGYVRDNREPVFTKEISKIHKYMMDASDYISGRDETTLCSKDRAAQMMTATLRGQRIRASVDAYNVEGIIPNVYEIGPGDFWLPQGLKQAGCKFNYYFSGFETAAAVEFRSKYTNEYGNGDYNILVACELIEHLKDPFDIWMYIDKFGVTNPDEIHLSTPRYCFSVTHQWDSNDNIGRGQHLRTYTPNEFRFIAHSMFPDYNWTYSDSEIMSLVGKLKKSV